MHHLNAVLLSFTLKKAQVPVVSATNIGVSFTSRFCKPWLQPSAQNSLTLNTRKNCSESTSSLSRRKQEVEIDALYLWFTPLSNWLKRCFSQNWGFGEGHTFQSSQINMDSGQDCQLETKWFGFCMMSGTPRERLYLIKWSWKVRMTVSAQRNSYIFSIPSVWMDTIPEPRNAEPTSQGCFPKQSRFSLGTYLRRLATRPPIVLYLDECLRKFNKLCDHSESMRKPRGTHCESCRNQPEDEVNVFVV